MLMIFIISLIVLAFAQVSRREQRNSLDRQLSSQAYYAAESGINDATKLISSGADVSGYQNCSNDLTNSANAKINEDGSVKYTCVTINTTPQVLNGTASPSKPVTFHLKSNTPLLSVKISWRKPATATGTLGNCPSTNGDVFTANTGAAGNDWKCPFSVLRYDLTQIPAAGFNRATLENLTQTAFVVPLNGAGSSVAFAPGQTVGRGNRVAATTCDTDTCSVTITGLADKDYYLNTQLIYGTSTMVSVQRTGAGNTGVFTNSQIQIDSTGKAQDVLRRVRIVKNVDGDANAASAAMVVGDGPCKLMLLPLRDDGGLDYENGACSE
jgi:Tfp pilus assembly protein PilX